MNGGSSEVLPLALQAHPKWWQGRGDVTRDYLEAAFRIMTLGDVEANWAGGRRRSDGLV